MGDLFLLWLPDWHRAHFWSARAKGRIRTFICPSVGQGCRIENLNICTESPFDITRLFWELNLLLLLPALQIGEVRWQCFAVPSPIVSVSTQGNSPPWIPVHCLLVPGHRAISHARMSSVRHCKQWFPAWVAGICRICQGSNNPNDHKLVAQLGYELRPVLWASGVVLSGGNASGEMRRLPCLCLALAFRLQALNLLSSAQLSICISDASWYVASKEHTSCEPISGGRLHRSREQLVTLDAPARTRATSPQPDKLHFWWLQFLANRQTARSAEKQQLGPYHVLELCLVPARSNKRLKYVSSEN